jgi:membrane-associated phospholipid phosphatase
MKRHFHKPSARWLILFGGIIVPLVAFGVLAHFVSAGADMSWDVPFLNFIHTYATPNRDSVMVLVTRLGSAAVVVPLSIAMAVVLFWWNHRRGARYLALAVLGAASLNQLVKIIFHRVRPHLWTSPAPESDAGFPSGHAMVTMAFVISVVVLTWPTRWHWIAVLVGGLFVFAVGLSRAYLGVHFPSDILAGWALSLAWVTALGFVSANKLAVIHWPKEKGVFHE